MMYEYKLQFSVDVLKAAPGVGKALEPTNNALAECGVGVGVRARLLTATVSAAKALTRKERDKVKACMLEAVRKHFPAYDFRLESMRRKSRQSRSKSR